MFGDLVRHGGVIVEEMLDADVLARINDEVDPWVAAADPAMRHLNPALDVFFGNRATWAGSPADRARSRPSSSAIRSCSAWLRTEEKNYLATPPHVVRDLPRSAQELIGYAVHDAIADRGGYLGMLNLRDPIELLAEGRLGAPTVTGGTKVSSRSD